MCELMGMSFARPVAADFSVREFALRSHENPDGWGLAWYPDRSASLVKEPLRWGDSKYTTFLETYPGLRSTVYVAHVRHRTAGGPPSHSDTHPFVRELDGTDYVFAHNGTLRGPFWDIPLRRFRPVGTTDSERLFCLLLGDLAARGGGLAAEANRIWLWERLTALNRHGKLNCILSDGRLLVAYHDARGFKGLHRRRVLLSRHATRHFADPELAIDLEGEAANHGFVVATHPLSRNEWEPFRPGEMAVFEKGVLVEAHAPEPARASRDT
ncbi:MAG TPA: class II glutamine amidotransferase [Gemmataceae bacterium]